MKITFDSQTKNGISSQDFWESCIENESCLEINRLPARSNLIPALHEGVYYRNKEESELLQSLNGLWQFCYCKEDRISGFEQENFDSRIFDTIDVPSMWQYRGYGHCEYPNICYPIPFDPPFVRKKNPVGYYRKEFYAKPSEHTILHFGGVDNCFFVWLNGTLIGFSKGSRIPAEFDLSGVIREGKNLLAVKVYTYSDATYLENQDMLLASGIFRDVYLLHLGAVSVYDYRLRSDRNGFDAEITFWDGDVTRLQSSSGKDGIGMNVQSGNAQEPLFQGWQAEIEMDGQRQVVPVQQKVRVRFDLKNPKYWNAEEPNLYEFTLQLIHHGKTAEVHSKKTGILWSSVRGNRFLVNDTPIYIKGVNRHEYNCRNGRAITVKQIEEEVRLIKNSNFNAVRCSHYTNNPAFYEYASLFGIYVMDEADIETHGCEVTGDQGYLSKKPEWFPAYLDRVVRMCEGQKNEPCVFLWSIGNECGRGENLVRCAEYIRIFDPSREVMQVQDDPFHPEFIHFRKTGYWSKAQIEKQKPEGYPVIMAEYAHSMGNSPGYLQGYWEYVYAHEQMAGGFIWEFKNHGFHARDEAGREFYQYGGDFGDICHWANFSLDGLLLSDGTPKPAWKEASQVYAPVYAGFKNGTVQIYNSFDFIQPQNAYCEYEICEDGKPVQAGRLDIRMPKPHEWSSLKLEPKVTNPVPGAVYDLNLAFYGETNQQLGFWQFRLPECKAAAEYAAAPMKAEVSMERGILSIKNEHLEVRFEDGMLCFYAWDGAVILSERAECCFYRAPTDNDGIARFRRRHISEWNHIFLNHFSFTCRSLKTEQKKDRVVVEAEGMCCPQSKYVGYRMKMVYELFADGVILFDITGTPYGRMTDVIPRIGMVFRLDKKFRNVSWCGRGPGHSYRDFKRSAPVGRYSAHVEEMNFQYDMPQETGNHEDTRWVCLSDGDGNGLTAASISPFAFSCHDFSLNALTEAEHRNELIRSDDWNYLYLDYAMRALGSRSCGPEPEPEYELHPHMYRQVFVLAPGCGEETAQTLARTDFGKRSRALSGPYHCPEETAHAAEYADCDLE